MLSREFWHFKSISRVSYFLPHSDSSLSRPALRFEHRFLLCLPPLRLALHHRNPQDFFLSPKALPESVAHHSSPPHIRFCTIMCYTSPSIHHTLANTVCPRPHTSRSTTVWSMMAVAEVILGRLAGRIRWGVETSFFLYKPLILVVLRCVSLATQGNSQTLPHLTSPSQIWPMFEDETTTRHGLISCLRIACGAFAATSWFYTFVTYTDPQVNNLRSVTEHISKMHVSRSDAPKHTSSSYAHSCLLDDDTHTHRTTHCICGHPILDLSQG